MNNVLDKFSKPLNVEDIEKEWHVLWKKITFNPGSWRKWRVFMPIYDHRFPLVEWFNLKYTYNVLFKEQNNAAWNHYHNIKEEILIPLDWEFEIHLEDTSSKVLEILKVNSNEYIWVYVPVWIAHKVISKWKTWVLCVLASNHSLLEDEVEYLV